MVKLHVAPVPREAIDTVLITYENRVNALRESFTQLREEAQVLAQMREAVLFRGTSTEHIVRSIKHGTATTEALLQGLK